MTGQHEPPTAVQPPVRPDPAPLPSLPDPAPEDDCEAPLTCPHVDPTGARCGERLSYATTVREYHRVAAYDGRELYVDGQNTDMDSTNDPDALFCGNGHEWAVPASVTYE